MARDFPSGRLVLSVLALSTALWAVMVYGTLAHLTDLADGQAPFDMRPLGYGVGEAQSLLADLGAAGRDYYAHVQLLLDTIYPTTYAISRGLLFWWLTMPGRLSIRAVPTALRLMALSPPLAAAGFDYFENNRIAAMLAIGPSVEPDLVATASAATSAKSAASLVTEVAAAVLLIVAGFQWWRRKRVRAM
jgi:hypothetical protein